MIQQLGLDSIKVDSQPKQNQEASGKMFYSVPHIYIQTISAFLDLIVHSVN